MKEQELQNKHWDIITGDGGRITNNTNAAKAHTQITLSYTEDRVKELEEQVNTWKNIDKRHVETILELSREIEALEGKLEVANKTMARAYLLIETKVSDNLGIRIDMGTVFNKDQVLKEIESQINQTNTTKPNDKTI